MTEKEIEKLVDKFEKQLMNEIRQIESFIASINKKEIVLRYNDKAQKERKKKREMDNTTVNQRRSEEIF